LWSSPGDIDSCELIELSSVMMVSISSADS